MALALQAVSDLTNLLHEVPRRFRQFGDEEVKKPRAEGKWSRLQILGHVCDSAINNLNRFVSIQGQSEPLVIASYNQNVWVEAGRYNEASAEEIMALWVSLNQSVLRVVSGLSASVLSHLCRLPDGTEVTLEWLIGDYVDHLKHHLEQIFPGDSWN